MESITSQVKTLGSYNALAADPLLGTHARALAPLLENVSTKSRYKIRKLGTGAFGSVNLESIDVGNVATKYSLVNPDNDSEDLINEIAALRYLRGLPHVAQLVGVGAPTIEQPFPVPILAKAKSSLESPALYKSWDDIYNILRQVLLGYYVIHERRIVHRDTKPTNMLITDIGEVQISDFGFSKYITQVPPTDNYTGTLVFSSPELLMRASSDYVVGNKQPVNWFAHDVWGVGMSLYYIITGNLLLSDGEIHDVLASMFNTLGTPTEDDGEVFFLYKDYKDIFERMSVKYDSMFVKRPKISAKDLILANAKFKPDDPTILDQIASMIDSMLNYDPAKRPTIKTLMALQIINPYGIPPISPHPALTPGDYVLPAELTMGMYITVTNWLYTVYRKHQDNITLRMIVMDRTMIYTLKILDIARIKSHPEFTKRRYIQAVGCIALYISSKLYEEYGYNMKDLNYWTAKAYSTSELFKFLREILTFDFQYYGKTVYDELLEMEVAPRMQWKLGYLNMICYQNEFYKKFPVEDVKRLMLKHARTIFEDPETLKYEHAKPFIDDVLALASPDKAVGGASRRKSRRSRLRRKATRRKSYPQI